MVNKTRGCLAYSDRANLFWGHHRYVFALGACSPFGRLQIHKKYFNEAVDLVGTGDQAEARRLAVGELLLQLSAGGSRRRAPSLHPADFAVHVAVAGLRQPSIGWRPFGVDGAPRAEWERLSAHC